MTLSPHARPLIDGSQPGRATAPLFGLDERELRPLLDRVALRERDDDGRQHLLAAIVWSMIAEPGDRDAGTLTGALGGVRALEAVIDGTTPTELVRRLHDATGEALEEPDDLQAAISRFRAALDRWRPRAVARHVHSTLLSAARQAVRVLCPGDEEWPMGLDDLGPHAPSALWLRGDPGRLVSLARSIAVVGARAATAYGESVAIEMSAVLCDRGFAVLSGAAYGIDGAAHRAALARGGVTAAVLAGGVDRFYPSGHDGLLHRIVEHGVVLSEVPCGSPPTKWRFLQRNRLLAALSQATVVVEAGRRSGSLNTAGHAAALGRALGAVPGPVTSAASAGCHRLIREYDAVCVTNAEEVIALHPEGAEMQQALFTSHDPEQLRLLDALSSRAARDTLEVSRRSGLAVARVQAILGALELEGAVVSGERGWRKASGSGLS
ncbi:DNA-processing protein DprA [Ruicaihuangia caeni]|uniref:DNA-processing protein DprA n=1 Tax=Ruicaihuangia caeni TaxID=3042517 RepID=A0AAW6T1L2_9MICO|nr:DNA-processing protein DprA [Klugiella sp. YN-L-19]MDI2097715.1 DNA-processing protein DprA [Klugiella sp. YN-L-19]